MQPFGRIKYGPKRGAVPLWGGGAGSPSNTMWSGPRSTCMPSFILIRQTAWPQHTNVTDRQDRTDNGPIAQGEPLYKRSPKNRDAQKRSSHKAVESVLRPEGSLWWERFMKKVGLETGVKERELWMVRVVS